MEGNAQTGGGIAHTAADSQPGTAVAGEFRNLVADIEDLVRAGTSMTTEDLARLKQKIAERINAAKDNLEHGRQTILARARKAANATDDYVNEEPWKSVAVGATIGFLVGLVVTRR